MANQQGNNIKLGVFVMAGLFVLILAFYMIGKNQNMFGSNFALKSRFNNLNGLIEGDNVLFSGIQAGTVKNINIINDTTIEVTLLIDNKIRGYIHKNAVVSIGTEGLMGNKIVNISPGKGVSPVVQEGDLLAAQRNVNTDEMLQTLSKTNNNVAVISEALKRTVLRIDSSSLFTLLNDKNIGASVKSSLANINKATASANEMTRGLNEIVSQIKKGKGMAGALLSDTALAGNLKVALVKIKSASDNANQMTVQLNNIVKDIKQEMANGKGPMNTLLKDSVMAKNLSQSMDNIQKGTDNFNQDMEALKHNFLFSGYFKKLEKQREKEKEASKAQSVTN
jgi:phospholipid/cholesterol/gamma-HCH transport system substrate-binding protein